MSEIEEVKFLQVARQSSPEPEWQKEYRVIETTVNSLGTTHSRLLPWTFFATLEEAQAYVKEQSE